MFHTFLFAGAMDAVVQEIQYLLYIVEGLFPVSAGSCAFCWVSVLQPKLDLFLHTIPSLYMYATSVAGQVSRRIFFTFNVLVVFHLSLTMIGMDQQVCLPTERRSTVVADAECFKHYQSNILYNGGFRERHKGCPSGTSFVCLFRAAAHLATIYILNLTSFEVIR